MTLKLSPPQAHALFNLFNDAVLPNYSNNLDKQLVMLHMIAIYKKLRNKWEGDAKKAYSLTLNAAEMVAYRIYWRDNELVRGAYEWAFLIDQCAQIDQEIASKRRLNTSNNIKLLNN